MQQTYTIFGTYPASPTPSNFYGQNGWWQVPGGRNWYMMSDKDGQMWASPNELQRNDDGSVSTVDGSIKFACELNADYSYVFYDTMANRQLGRDCPAPDRLSPTN